MHNDTAGTKVTGMYKNRNLSAKTLRLFETFSVVVLAGARQTGKTTLLQHLFPDADYVVFDPVIDVENAREDPELFLDNHRCPLVLDEIQYAPELVSVINRRVEAARSPGMYILTGSQQWQVLKSIAESLAGRAVFVDLGGFSIGEQLNNSDGDNWLSDWINSPSTFLEKTHQCYELPCTLYELLWRGQLPDATLLPMDVMGDYWLAYERTYIERDVRVLAELSDWQQFGRFLRLCAALSSQEINYSQLGRDIGLTPRSARHWLDLLTATFQWFKISAFKGNLVKRVSSKPKGYFTDTGLMCHAQQISSPRALPAHPLAGSLFETLVVNEVLKLSIRLSGRIAFHHWRSAGGAEVDLILESDGVFYPMEIKLASNPRRRDTSGLEAFRKSYPQLNIAPGIILSPSRQVNQISPTVWSLPWNLKQ